MKKLFFTLLMLSITTYANAQKIPTLTAMSSMADGDLYYCVDVSDTTADATGTGKKCTNAQIKSYTLNGLASSDLSDVSDLLLETELDTFSELQTQIADATLLKGGTLTDTLFCTYNSASSSIVCNSAGTGSGLNDVVDDTTPQLGGDLDVNGNDLVSVTDGNINIIPNGTGKVGIGTSAPSTMLEVNGALTVTGSGANALDNAVIATYLEIPNGTSPTVDDAGEIALDTTDSQLKIYDGTSVNVLSGKISRCAVIDDLSATDDNRPLGSTVYARTITKVGCRCNGTCTTGAQISLEDTGGNAMTHTTPTCATSGAITFQSVTAGGALTAGEGLRVDVDNAVDPETDTYEICFEETIDAT